MRKRNFLTNLFNGIFILLILLGTLYIGIFRFKRGYLATYIMAPFLVLIPYAFSTLIFKLSSVDRLVYFVFLFFAYFLGSVVGLYSSIYWYDILMHFSSGFVFGYIGKLFLESFNISSSRKPLFSFMFCFIFAVSVAGIWEIGEFSVDQITGSNLQHSIDTGVVDTMQDLICGTVGGLIYSATMCCIGKK